MQAEMNKQLTSTFRELERLQTQLISKVSHEDMQLATQKFIDKTQLAGSLQNCVTRSLLDTFLDRTVSHEMLSKEIEAVKKANEKTIGEAQQTFYRTLKDSCLSKFADRLSEMDEELVQIKADMGRYSVKLQTFDKTQQEHMGAIQGFRNKVDSAEARAGQQATNLESSVREALVHQFREETDKKLSEMREAFKTERQEEFMQKLEQLSVQFEKRQEDTTFANKEAQCQTEESIEKLQAQLDALKEAQARAQESANENRVSEDKMQELRDECLEHYQRILAALERVKSEHKAENERMMSQQLLNEKAQLG